MQAILNILKDFVMWIKDQIEWVKSFAQEPDGSKASSRRLIELGIVIVFLISYMKVSLATQTLEDMPWGWFTMIATILGMKVYSQVKSQNGNGTTTIGEEKKTDPAAPPVK